MEGHALSDSTGKEMTDMVAGENNTRILTGTQVLEEDDDKMPEGMGRMDYGGGDEGWEGPP